MRVLSGVNVVAASLAAAASVMFLIAEVDDLKVVKIVGYCVTAASAILFVVGVAALALAVRLAADHVDAVGMRPRRPHEPGSGPASATRKGRPRPSRRVTPRAAHDAP